MEKQFNRFSSFVLKMIAIVTMTIDHIGAAIQVYLPQMNDLGVVFRYIGRFALPLFCFCIAEGVIHTHSYKKYALKLGAFALLIAIILTVCYCFPSLNLSSVAYEGNIFLDLLLGSFMIYAIRKKELKWYLLAIIPVAISIISFAAKCYEISTPYSANWFPPFLRMQYDWLSLGFIFVSYISYKLADAYFDNQKNYTGIELETIKGTNQYRIGVNLIAALGIIIVSALYYVVNLIAPQIVFWDSACQLFSMATAIIVIFYSGKRGYNAKWFNIGQYFYYPLHVIIIYGIFYLISII